MIDDSTVAPVVRQSSRRPLIAALIVVAVVSCYLLAAISYGSSIRSTPPSHAAPDGGISVVFVPQVLLESGQEVTGYVLLFPARQLLTSDGKLRVRITLTVTPAIGTGTITYREGQASAPQALALPAVGVVEQYPFDRYQVDSRIVATAQSGLSKTSSTPLKVMGSSWFRLPGWRLTNDAAVASGRWDATIVRSGSTKAIAILLLGFMVALALIAGLVVNATLRRRVALELATASWITAMLFALLPVRGFLPGAPPIGSWIDILVFFWVELTLMVCVGTVAMALLLRARRTNS